MLQPAKVTVLTRRLPTHDEIASAAKASRALAQARTEHGGLQFGGTNHDRVQLAPAVADLIVDLLGHIAQGNMVTLVPTGAMLTTQEAADILNLSPSFLGTLLQKNEIPHLPAGSQRPIKFEDLMAYKERRDSTRKKALDELADRGQEFDAEWAPSPAVS